MNSTERNFDFLRVSLETHLTFPSIVTVTSAMRGDGTSTVAEGLAEAFAASGTTTLLVSTQSQPASVSRRIESRGSLARATAEQLTADVPGGRATLARSFSTLRESYPIIVIETEAVPESSFALELARGADAVLVAIRMGRRGCAADRTTKALLEECGANVLGIVPTHGNARMHANAEKTLRVPAIEVSKVVS